MSGTRPVPEHPAATSATRTVEPGPAKHVLFFGDPMCSWCWGFAPELERIRAACADRAAFHMVMGGLRPGAREPWDVRMRAEIRHHWQDVQTRTGQPFDFARFDDAAFVYDTEPACRALVCVRELAPDQAPAMYEALQRAFYAQNRDITDPAILAEIAVGTGVARERFQAMFVSPAAREATAFDFQRTRAFGVSGFPTVVCADHGQYAFLTLGYRPFAAIGPLLEEWLNA